jgi:phage-related protein
MAEIKRVQFWGSALDDLRSFPKSIRRDAGYQIDQVQRGVEPDDWKTMTSIGSGVCEIRIQDDAGAFRVLYVARFADAVHVLHCFQKKSRKTSQRDIDLAKRRYRDFRQELSK